MINVAIDGPSGAGKSTIAKAVAERLGYIYVDTGALYRAVGLYAVRHGISPNSLPDVTNMLGSVKVDIKYIDGSQRVYLNGEDVSSAIREHEVSRATSDISAHPPVREFLLNTQRSIAEQNNVIMDGRDIGTTILPNAQIKIFLTASPEARARRRYDELIACGQDVNYEQILHDVKERDYNDSHRAVSPLKMAPDAVLIDTTDITLEESVEAVFNIINNGVRTDG